MTTVHADTPVFVDIDWDFFAARPAENDVVYGRDPLSGSPLAAPHWIFTPPRGSESEPPSRRDTGWRQRYRAALDHGLDLPTHHGWRRPPFGPPSVAEFVDRIQRRVDPGPLLVADSHRHALDHLRAVAPHGGARVLHFDAHHDLGYCPARLADDQRAGRVSCESWLLRALRDELVAEIVLIYPDWAPRTESEANPVHLLDATEREKVRWTTWSDWVTAARWTADWAPNCCGVFAARSSWWSPPWMDPGFQTLVETLCVPDFGFVEIDDCLSPRPFDEAALREAHAADIEHERHLMRAA